ncbi:MAG: L-serine ammonia-lyase, iron-sulfur-dependent, subunit alpha, partial [Acidaminococcaceae bacterium]|nr:L-serine ammonia-lyase, iron-sulfur-dependent, subunit alpha [Acidaminococcaceae bacterium]
MNNNKLSLAAIIKRADETDKPLHEVMLNANAEELETAPIALMAKMQEMLMVMDESIKFGLTGVRSRSGLTGGAAKSFGEALNHKGFKHLLGPVAEDALTYALAVGEANACMGRIVAAPTAGASGVLPGVMFALKKHYSLTNIDMQKGLVVAGNVGMVIASRASLSGAMGGCQAECGSAAAMAAAAAVYMLGGTNQAVDTAIAIVIKNMLGLVCDPVAGLVEVPCVKRN